MAVYSIMLCLAAASIVHGLQMHDMSTPSSFAQSGQTGQRVAVSGTTNPCNDPTFPFAASVGEYVWCYKDHHSAATKAARCDLWCTLDVDSGDNCAGCCGDMSKKKCQQQAATPAPTADSFLLDLYNSHVAENNLGDLGPAADPLGPADSSDYIRYKHVDSKNGMVDLVISNVSTYTPENSSRNGLTDDGHWARVNLKCGTSTTLRFAFEQSETGIPLTMDKFYLTVADIDQGLQGQCKESVEVDGYAEYALSDFTEITESQRMGGKLFVSNTQGTDVDDPSGLELTEQQKNRAISFFFESAQSFTVTIATTDGEPGDETGETGEAGEIDETSGRNFLFAGATSMSKKH